MRKMDEILREDQIRIETEIRHLEEMISMIRRSLSITILGGANQLRGAENSELNSLELDLKGLKSDLKRIVEDRKFLQRAST